MPRYAQVVIATLPALLTPLLIYSLAEGILDFGGGEKDILLALPWLIWSIVFALSGYVLIYRRWAVGRWTRRSSFVATGVLLALGLVTYVGSHLGIG